MGALPDEVLHKIFAELEDQLPLDEWQLYGAQLDHQGSAALRNLCLVSRQFRRIAQPLLYRTIVIEGCDDAKDITTVLLRTFVENSQLAEQVRAVSLTDRATYSAQVEILGKDATKKIVRLAMENLDLPPALNRFMKRHIASCGFLALILAYMPHVQVVDCTMGDKPTILPWQLSASPHVGRPRGFPVFLPQSDLFDDEDYVVDFKNQDNPEESQEQKGSSKGTFANHCFPNLTEIRIRAVEGPEDIEGARGIEPLLLNSTLKILRAFGTAWYGDELASLVWPTHRNHNLQYLDLIETYIDAEGLKTVLTRCPNLKGIAIRLPDEYRTLLDHYETEGSDNGDCIINLDDFGDVLRQFG
ncbi:hypothetical protein F25303_9668 [Fusarium sp. NRRL 25303]|nr:hypothetical protein F25303_9668 [Fusarium sp. NRRL 25303]